MDIYGDHLLHCERDTHIIRRRDAQVRLLQADLTREMDGIRTLIVPCAQWQQQLPLVECPLSALLRAFCSSDTWHYS